MSLPKETIPKNLINFRGSDAYIFTKKKYLTTVWEKVNKRPLDEVPPWNKQPSSPIFKISVLDTNFEGFDSHFYSVW